MSANFKSNRSWQISLIAALFAIACLAPGTADARKRRKRKRKAAAAKVNVRALGELMGPFRFGMSRQQVLKVLSNQLDERYEDKIKETTDIYKQDKLRRKKKAELKKIKSSFVEFKGKKTGWDVSIIDDQFAHKTDESMLVYWENNADGKDQRRFFFFYEGELYKMFIALDSSMVPRGQRNFDFFKGLMTAKYGAGKLVTKTKRSGAVTPVLVDWASKKYHVQAIDKLSFYGSFCLSIGSPHVERSVMAARDAVRVVKGSNAVIDSMLEGDSDTSPSLDSNKAAVDSLLQGN